MQKLRTVLGSKIHRAVVTHADLHYEGSLTIPPELLEAADIRPFEQVHVWNVTNGSRVQTYAIEGEPGSTAICANGAAAHQIQTGDVVIIATFVQLPEAELEDYCPKVVFVDEHNRIIRQGKELAGPLTSAAPEAHEC